MDWPMVGLLLAVGSVGVLVGAAMGYFTAATDLDVEKAQAWEDGFEAGTHDERKYQEEGEVVVDRRNPYRRRTK